MSKSPYRSSVRTSERWALHSLLLLEHVFGERLRARLLGRFKKRALRGLEERLSSRTPPAPLTVDRRESLTPEEFQRDYFRPGVPVIISGAAAGWNCVSRWSLDYLRAGYGEKDLLLVSAPGLTSRAEGEGFEFLSLRDLVTNIRAKGEKYLRFSPLLHDNPALAGDLDLGWFERMRGGSSFARTYYMFLGGAGQRTLLHNDQPCNFYVQVSGEKIWNLFSPRDSALLYPQTCNTAYVRSQVNFAAPDRKAHPLFEHAQRFEARLRPGDILYIPPFYWHEVENLSETIAVSYRFSSLPAALRSSLAFLILRLLSTNPPVWKTIAYGKQDTNLIWAHRGGFIREVLTERDRRQEMKSRGLAGK